MKNPKAEVVEKLIEDLKAADTLLPSVKEYHADKIILRLLLTAKQQTLLSLAFTSGGDFPESQTHSEYWLLKTVFH